MKPFIGQHFGAFIELEENRIEGLIPLSSFQNGEFEFDAVKQKISIQSATFTLGTKVHVLVKDTDSKQRKIMFNLKDAEHAVG